MRSPAEVREARVRQWVESARDDLAWADMGATAPEPRGVAQTGFHAQQASESCARPSSPSTESSPKTQHSPGRLVDRVRRLDPQTADRIGHVSGLTQYAVSPRDPPRVAGNAQPLKRDAVLRDPDRARSAFPVVLAAIEARLAHANAGTAEQRRSLVR